MMKLQGITLLWAREDPLLRVGKFNEAEALFGHGNRRISLKVILKLEIQGNQQQQEDFNSIMNEPDHEGYQLVCTILGNWS